MSLQAVALDFLLVAASVLALAVGASQFVTGASRIARRVGLSGLVIGLTVVAFGTSAPEFAVTLDAAFAAKSDISVGNVVGSNILNLGFILGGAALLRRIRTSRELVVRDSAVLIGTTVLTFAFLGDLRVSRLEGTVLVALLVGYLFVLARTGSERVRAGETTAVDVRPADVVGLVGGLAAVILGAHLLVLAASDIAREAGLSEWVIGVTVVAVGTSTPELVTSIVAARRGRSGISAGNLVGSCIFNFLGVLGAAAVVRPLSVAPTAIGSMGWLLGIVLVAVALFRSSGVLSRLEGLVLIALNAVNWALDFVRL